jgi:hypothetical protein
MMSDDHESRHGSGHGASGHGSHGDDGDFGVTKITIAYHWKGRQYEIDLDPNRVDVLIFGSENVKRFKPALPKPVGGPVSERLGHLNPDGTMHNRDPKAKVEYWPAEKAGIFGTPRRVGRAVDGSPDDFCWHNIECNWWCVAGDHSPLEE